MHFRAHLSDERFRPLAASLDKILRPFLGLSSLQFAGAHQIPHDLLRTRPGDLRQGHTSLDVPP